MEMIKGVFQESYLLLNEMSVYLVFGFVVAGILHIFLKQDMIARHLGKNNLSSVLKASLFGIPLPLCSCGVLPTALSLKRDGASKSSILSFLISTPTTGVDSILASYALLGGFFTAFRVAACFVTAFTAGALGTVFLRDADQNDGQKPESCHCCHDDDCSGEKHSLFDKLKEGMRYAFRDLLGEVGPWLILGIVIGGAIAYFVPDDFIGRHLGSVWPSMFIMLLVGIPMYVCSTGSIPIAMTLMMKGLNPGAAFVFLLAGPATNSVALTVIAKNFGKKTVVIFLLSVIVCGLALGALLDGLWKYFDVNVAQQIMHHQELMPHWLEALASVLLLGFMLFNVVQKNKAESCH